MEAQHVHGPDFALQQFQIIRKRKKSARRKLAYALDDEVQEIDVHAEGGSSFKLWL